MSELMTLEEKKYPIQSYLVKLDNWSIKRKKYTHSNYLASLDKWNLEKTEIPDSVAIFRKAKPRQTKSKAYR